MTDQGLGSGVPRRTHIWVSMATVLSLSLLDACAGGNASIQNYRVTNEAVLDALPTPSGVRIVGTTTDPTETDSGTRIGWTTARVFEVSRRSAQWILNYYVQRMSGWRVTDRCCGQQLVTTSFRKGPVTVVVNVDDLANGRFEVSADAHSTTTRDRVNNQ